MKISSIRLNIVKFLTRDQHILWPRCAVQPNFFLWRFSLFTNQSPIHKLYHWVKNSGPKLINWSHKPLKSPKVRTKIVFQQFLSRIGPNFGKKSCVYPLGFYCISFHLYKATHYIEIWQGFLDFKYYVEFSDVKFKHLWCTYLCCLVLVSQWCRSQLRIAF